MTNNYEASEVFEVGNANDIVLGSKPQVSELDATFGFGRQQIAEPDDIDESE